MAFPYDGPYGRGKRAQNVTYGKTPFSNVGFRPLKKNPYSSSLFQDPGGGGGGSKKAATAAPQATDASETAHSNLMDYGPDDEQPVAASADGAGNIDRTNISQGMGYEVGTGNYGGLGTLLGMATGIPFAGNLASKAMDALDLPGTYGNFETTDHQGNIFGREGRAYDPITGRAVGSYGNTGDWWNSTKGGYDQLRAAGENPLSAGLGSYENSIYNFGATPGDPSTYAAARGARLRGGDYENTGVMSTNAMINANTFNPAAPTGETNEDYLNEAYGLQPNNPISAEQLGFTNERAYDSNLVNNNSGQWGTGTGDLVATEYGPGVLTENDQGQRQISHGGGTVIGLTNTADPSQGNISLLATSDEGRAAADAELARRAGQDDGGNNNAGPGTPLSEIPGTVEHNQAQYEKEAYGHQDSGGGDDGGGGGGGK